MCRRRLRSVVKVLLNSTDYPVCHVFPRSYIAGIFYRFALGGPYAVLLAMGYGVTLDFQRGLLE